MQCVHRGVGQAFGLQLTHPGPHVRRLHVDQPHRAQPRGDPLDVRPRLPCRSLPDPGGVAGHPGRAPGAHCRLRRLPVGPVATDELRRLQVQPRLRSPLRGEVSGVLVPLAVAVPGAPLPIPRTLRDRAHACFPSSSTGFRRRPGVVLGSRPWSAALLIHRWAVRSSRWISRATARTGASSTLPGTSRPQPEAYTDWADGDRHYVGSASLAHGRAHREPPLPEHVRGASKCSPRPGTPLPQWHRSPVGYR